jgi:hypothetical protein
MVLFNTEISLASWAIPTHKLEDLKCASMETKRGFGACMQTGESKWIHLPIALAWSGTIAAFVDYL